MAITVKNQALRKSAAAVLRIIFFIVYISFLTGIVLFARAFKISRLQEHPAPVLSQEQEIEMPHLSFSPPVELEEAPPVIPQPELTQPLSAENVKNLPASETGEELLSPLENPQEPYETKTS